MKVKIKKLKIKFPNGWIDISDKNPDGPPTFIDGKLEEPGVLQISTAEYISGALPDPDYDDLIALSKKIGLKNEFGKISREESGSCTYGRFGNVEFSRSDFPYISVWHLSNGKDFVFSTFICSRYPDSSELDDVKGILMSIKKKRLLF